MKQYFCVAIFCIGLSACNAYNPMEDYELREPTTHHDVPTLPTSYSEFDVQRGKYLAELLACGTCHTDGALIGEVNLQRQFAGSRVGIAYSNPFKEKFPGILYPANITPDPKTGIGNWSDDEIVNLLRTGVDANGKMHIPVMPWPAYAKINNDDAKAIVAFLRSLAPVSHEVPAAVAPGKRASAPYVHFGVYQSKHR